MLWKTCATHQPILWLFQNIKPSHLPQFSQKYCGSHDISPLCWNLERVPKCDLFGIQILKDQRHYLGL
jgi:hypothetical protein